MFKVYAELSLQLMQ